MEIYYPGQKVEKRFKQALQAGSSHSQTLQRRLNDLEMVDNLEHALMLPGKCHALRENHAGKFAISISQNDRLIFQPFQDPTPRRLDGGLDLSKITKIQLLDIEDYH